MGVKRLHIETRRTILRWFEETDLWDLQAILGDSEAMANLEPAYDLEKTRAFLQTFCVKGKHALAVWEKQTGRVIGYVLFREVEDGLREIGWVFRREVWRKGFAYEACSALLSHAFSCMHVHKVFAETIDAEKSVGLMQKLGMRHEGTQRSHTRDLDGKWRDLYLYGLMDKGKGRSV